MVALSAGKFIPPEATPDFRKYLLTSKTDVLSADAIGQCIVRPFMAQDNKTVAKYIQVLLEDASIRELLESLLVLVCAKWDSCRESLTEIDNALRLISVITEKIPASSKLLKAVLQSISGSVVSDMLRQYTSQVQIPLPVELVNGHSTIDVCPLSYHQAQARLHQNFEVMILKCALHASSCGGYFDEYIMTLLLQKQSLPSPAQPAFVECTQRKPMNLIGPKISLFEAVSTPRLDSVSINWRDDLLRTMSRDIDCRYEGVTRMVGEICRDLELRCNEAERPLREEQSKSCDFQAKLESSERNIAELELQARNHHSTLSALETERGYLANQVETTERRLNDLRTSLESIHQEFDHAKIEAERAAQAAIESARQQDLAYLATMTGKDDIFELQSLKLASTEKHVENVEHELNHLRGLEANNAEKLNNNAAHIETLTGAVSTSECHVMELQNELIQIKEQNARNMAKISDNDALIEELSSTVLVMNEASDRNETLVSSLKDKLQIAEVETSELRLQHETYVSAKDAEIERLEESIRSSNEKWQSELEVTHRSAAVATEQSTSTIGNLHSKIRSLRKEREVRILGSNTALFYPRSRATRNDPGVYERISKVDFASKSGNANFKTLNRSGQENSQKLRSLAVDLCPSWDQPSPRIHLTGYNRGL